LFQRLRVRIIHRTSQFPRHVYIYLGRRYPIFGVQWHPEKNGFEWRVNTTIPHTKDAVEVMQYMANFLTDQARQNKNHFDSLEDETKYLIYQYTPEFLDLDESHFQQIYFFYE
jgi:gamma-glutamyl hydrolase